MSNPSTLTKAIPVLPSLDDDQTVVFYTGKLNFALIRRYDNYLIFSRDGVEIHCWRCDDQYIAENTSCYIRVENIEPLYEEYKARGVIHPNGHLEKKFYGMHEFAVVDNNGNLLRFGERTPDDQAS
jgi:hypothetical protein